MSEPMNFQTAATYGPPEAAPSWGYPPHTQQIDRGNYPHPPLPSIHSFGRNAPVAAVGVDNPPAVDHWQPEGSIREDAQAMTYRGWETDTTYHPVANEHPNNSFSPDPRSVPGSQTSPHSSNDGHQWSQPVQDPSLASRYAQEPYSQPGLGNNFDGSIYASASYAQHQTQSQYYAGNFSPSQNTSPPLQSIPPLPRHSYTRTLVGPLSANACRLLDEHRKPGVFFLFQDLSVRTEGEYLRKHIHFVTKVDLSEGTFRLRLRLMNVGA
jgi:hypothetical protein